MSDINNTLGQNSQDVFAQPLLQNASLLDDSSVQGFRRALAQMSGDSLLIQVPPINTSVTPPATDTSTTTTAATPLQTSTVFGAATAAAPLTARSGVDPLTGQASASSTPTVPTPPPTPPAFAVMAEGTVTVNGASDFDGDPLTATDDALMYAGKGFTLNGNVTLPVKRDARGNILRDNAGRPILVEDAVDVTQGYSVNVSNGNQYAGLNPPRIIAKQTLLIPAYADTKQQELDRRIPAGTPTVTFDARTTLNNANEWSRKFPTPGTASQPNVVRITNGGLTIPSGVNLSHTVIIVDNGDINFNGSNHNFNNVVLVANNGNVQLANLQADHLSVLASGSIQMNAQARFGGSTLLATETGNITFNGATKGTDAANHLRVIAQGDLTYNGSAQTRGSLLSAKNVTFNGFHALHGSVRAKGNIIFNGNSTVIGDTVAPTITGDLERDTAINDTNTDRITSDPTIRGSVLDNQAVLSLRANFQNRPSVDVLALRQPDGSFRFSRSQLEQIYGGTLPDGVHTLQLQAQDAIGNLSSPFELTFTLDTQILPPTLQLPASSDSGSSNQDRITRITTPTLTGQAEPGAIVQLFQQQQLLGSATADANGLWQFTTAPLANGLHQFHAIATDVAGNVSAPSPTLNVTVDAVLPQITLLQLAEGATLKNGASLAGSVSGTGSAITTLTYRWDNQPLKTLSLNANGQFQQALDFSGIINGAHTLTLSATDQAGNVSTTTLSVTVAIDREAPQITATLLRDTAPNNTLNTDRITFDPTLSGTIADASRIVEFRAGFNSTAPAQFVDITAQWQANQPFSLTRTQLEQIYGGPLPEGPQTLRLQAKDEFGNTSGIVSIQFTLDTVLPQVTLTTPIETIALSNRARLAGSIDGTGSAIALLTYHFDQRSPISLPVNADGTFDQPFDLTELNNGAHILTLTATDIAGNTRIQRYNVVIAVDQEGPVIVAGLVRDTAPQGTNTDAITFDPRISGTVSDANSVTVFRAGLNQTPEVQWVEVLAHRQANGQFLLERAQLEAIAGGPLPDGFHQVHLQAQDEFGNRSTVFTVAFTLDTAVAPPQQLQLANGSDTGVNPLDRITRINTPTLTGTAEAGATVQLFNGNQAIGHATADPNGSWRITTNPLSNGVHQLSAIATDIAGNVSQPSALFQVVIDAVLPEITLATDLTQPLRLGATLAGIAEGTLSDLSTLTYQWDDQPALVIQPAANGSFEQSLDFAGIAAGAHTLTLRAIDTAGNLHIVRYEVTVLLDTSAPSITAGLVRDSAPQGTNTDRITSDPRIQGRITDTSEIVTFKAGFNATPTQQFVNVLAQMQPDGQFIFDTAQMQAIYGGVIPDGQHTLHLEATDQYGNASQIFDFTFTLDTTLPLTLALDPAFDSGTLGDGQTTAAVIALSGQVEAGSTLVLLETGTTLLANANGQFTFSGIALAAGTNTFTVQATDIAGNQRSQTLTLSRLVSNNAPTDIQLSRQTLAENSPANTVVGILSTSDPDTQDTHTYTLLDSAGGRFQLIGNQVVVAPGAVLDYETANSWTIRVRTTDSGNPSLFVDKALTLYLTEVNEAPRFTSVPGTNAETDEEYHYTISTTDPENNARTITVGNLPSWLTFTDNGNGTAILAGTPNANQTGLSAIALTVKDAAGLSSTQTFLLAVDVVLREGTQFSPTQSVNFDIPQQPTLLEFTIDPFFDQDNLKAMNDAFEVALVDAKGRSLVHPFAAGRDAFFNWTEDEAVVVGAGVTYNPNTRRVQVNLTGVPAGTDARLIFRLVNNDGDLDTDTHIRIQDISLLEAPIGTPPPVSSNSGAINAANLTRPNFAVLQEVSSSFPLEYHRSTFNDQTNLLYTDVNVRNAGTYSVDAPLLVAIARISDPSVQVRNPDGYTPDGLPYYNFSALVKDGKLNPKQGTDVRSLVFHNPDQVRFTYEVVVLAQLNLKPVIQSQPIREALTGKPYQYAVQATDPNGDVLSYRLLSAPEGMVIEANVIQWRPTSTALGNHTVILEVSDQRNGVTRQTYTLTVQETVPNRPPQITTNPVVDAYVGETFTYDADAIDPDQDTPLTYSLISGPDTMTVDANTGKVTWKPSAALVLGDTVFGSINAPGQLDRFKVTGIAGQRLYFDPLKYTGYQSDWKLELVSPSGRKVVKDFNWNENRLVTLTEGGTYEVQVSRTNGTTGDYGFSLIDVSKAPVIATDTVITGKLTPGSEDDVFRFTATPGQKLFLDTLSANRGLNWILYNASNEAIASKSDFTDIETNLPKNTFNIAETGEYLLAIRGTATFNEVINYSFQVITPDIVTKPLVFGQIQVGEIKEKGEQDVYTFTGKAGQQLYLDAIRASGNTYFKIFDPTGKEIKDSSGISDLEPGAYRSNGPEFPLVLRRSGIYKIVVDGTNDTENSPYEFQVLNREDATLAKFDGNISEISNPAGIESYYFTLEKSEHIFFDGQGKNGDWKLFNENGLNIHNGFLEYNQENALAAGNYWLILQRSSQSNLRLIKSTFKSSNIESLTSTVTGSITNKGGKNSHIFDGYAGQQLYLDVISNPNNFSITVEDPQGRKISTSSSDVGPGNYYDYKPQFPLVLGTTGTYKVLVDGSDEAIGDYEFRILDREKAEKYTLGQIIEKTYSETSPSTIRNQAASYYFSLDQTQYIFFDGQAGNTEWKLFNQNGLPILEGGYTGGNKETFLSPGKYWLVLSGNVRDNNTYKLQLVTPTFQYTNLANLEHPISGNLAQKGERHEYTFSGIAGQQLFLDIIEPNSDLKIRIYDSTGKKIQDEYLNYDKTLTFNYSTNDFSYSDFSYSALPHNGTYTLVVDGEGDAIGSYLFRLLDKSNAIPISLGTPNTKQFNSSAAWRDAYRFTLESNQVIQIHSQGNGSWYLYDPNGIQKYSTNLGSDTTKEFNLVAGEYLLMFERNSSPNSELSYQFQVNIIRTEQSSLPATILIHPPIITEQDNSPATTPIQPPIITNSISVAGEIHRYRFQGTIGDRLFLDYQSSNSQEITLYDPTGTQIWSTNNGNRFLPPVLTLKGMYDLVVRNTGNYSFQLLNWEYYNNQKISLDEAVLGSFIAGQKQKPYQLNLTQKQTIFFDGQLGSNTTWHLFDQNSLPIVRFGSKSELELEAGKYWLFIQNNSNSPNQYQFKILTPEVSYQAITSDQFGQVISGRIEEKGESDIFTFTGKVGQHLFFDTLPNFSSLKFYIEDPTGARIHNNGYLEDTPSSNNKLLVLRMAGTYKLTIDGDTDTVGDYKFRLLDKEQATLVNFNPITGTFDPITGTFDSAGHEQHSYRFTLNEQKYLFFDGQRGLGNWKLYKSNGEHFEAAGLPYDDEFDLDPGDYWLLLQGDRNPTPNQYRLQILTPPLAAPKELIFGQRMEGSIQEKGETDTFYFTGVAGKHLYFDRLNGTSNLKITIKDPTGLTIFSGSLDTDVGPNRSIAELDLVLRMNGTYRLSIDGDGETNAAPYDFRLLDKADATVLNLEQLNGEFISFDSLITDNINSGRRSYKFTLTQKQSLFFDGQDKNGKWSLYGPVGPLYGGTYGYQIYQNEYLNYDRELELDAGEYWLLMEVDGGGNSNAQLRIVTPENHGTYQFGQTVTGSLNKGDWDSFTFEGVAGQQLFFDRIAGIKQYSIRVYEPTGTEIFSRTIDSDYLYDNPTHTHWETILNLRMNGTHTVVIDPRNDVAGTYTFKVFEKSKAEEITLNKPVQGSLGSSGYETTLYRFVGTAGQALYLDPSIANGQWALYQPSGELIKKEWLATDYQWTLSASGEYLLAVQGRGNSDPFQIRLGTVQQSTTNLQPLFGQAVSGELTAKGQQIIYTLSGTPGQKLFFDRLETATNVKMRLLSPTQVAIFDTKGDPGLITLTETGTYQVIIEGEGDAIGTYKFIATNLAQLTPQAIGLSTPGVVDSTQPTQVYRIDGQIGQVLELAMNFSQNSDPLYPIKVALYGTNNQEVDKRDHSNRNDPIKLIVPNSGSYTLVVTHELKSNYTKPIHYSLTLSDRTPTPQPVSGLDILKSDGTSFSHRTGAITAPNQVINQTFTASAGTRIYFDSKNADNQNVRIRVLNPNGSEVFSTRASEDVGPTQLHQTGTYTLWIEGVSSNSTGDYDFSLFEVLTKTPQFTDNVRRLALNTEITKPLDPGHTTDILAFEGTVGQTLLFDSILPDNTGFYYGAIDVKLIGPSGQVVLDLSHIDWRKSPLSDNNSAPFTLTESGTYNLMIIGRQPAKIDYRFKMWDLAAAQTLVPNRVYADNLLRGSDINLYKVSGKAGETLFFDAIASNRSNDEWILYRPGNAKELERKSLNQDFSYTLPVDGDYVLAIQGKSTTPASYRFAVSTLQDPPATLIPSDGESGAATQEGLGTYQVQIKVSDGKGGTDTQTFQVKVHPKSGNANPTIVSEAVTTAFTNRKYVYNVGAIDADADTLSYSLAESPQGMFIDTQTGQLSWFSPIAGTHRVKVRVLDPNGGIDYQTFDILVKDTANGLITGTVYNDVNKDGKLTLTNPNNLTPYTGVTIGDAFADQYTAYDLGVPNGLPYRIAAMTFFRDSTGNLDPNTMLVAAAAHDCGGVIYKVKVQRGQNGHIIGFDDDGDPTTPYVGEFYQYAPYISAGLIYGPDNKLILSSAKGRYSGLGIVPEGLPGAGQLKATSQGAGTGFYSNDQQQTVLLPGWSSAFVYVPTSAPNFDTGAGILIANSEGDRVTAYQVDDKGNPTLNTARPFLENLDNPLGAVIDPLTGDILFSAAGNEAKKPDGSDRNAILAVRALGRPTGNEAGLPNWLVYVDRNQDGERNVGEEYTYTDVHGSYQFTLEPGTFDIRQELPIGWSQTSPTNPFQPATVIANQTTFGINFGNHGVSANEPNQAPVFTSQPTQKATTGQRFLYRATATDLNADPLSFDLVLKPKGMAIAPNGTLSWVPGEDQVGEHSVILRVNDGNGGITLQAFTVAVGQGNRAPVVTSLDAPSQPQVGRLFRYQVTATDLDNDSLTFALVENPDQQALRPAGVTIDARTGLLSWTPTADQVGGAYLWGPAGDILQPWQVTVKVSDGKGGEAYQSFDWIVAKPPEPSQVNRAPELRSNPRTSAQVDREYVYQLDATDPDGNPLTYTIVSGPQGMGLQGQTLIWKPAAAQTGAHPVTVRVSDGSLAIQQSWSIQVSNTIPNAAPVITSVPTQQMMAIGQTYRYDLTATDVDHDALAWSLEQAPDGAVLNSLTGALRWQPTEDQLGIHEFTVRVWDRFGGFSTQSFNLQVTGVNAPPRFVSMPATIAGVGQPFAYQAIATDPEQQPLTFRLTKAPAGLTLHPSTGFLAWTPQGNQLGMHVVELQAIDEDGAIATQSFTLTVQAQAINTAPVINSTPNFLARPGQPYSYQVQASDPEGATLTYQLLQAPTGITIHPTTGLLAWGNPVIGEHTLVVGAVDPAGLGAAQRFTLTVRENLAPVIGTINPQTILLGSTYRRDVVAYDPEGQALSYQLDAAAIAKGFSIDEAGRIAWQKPTEGLHTAIVSVSDPFGATTQQSITIKVEADKEAPKVQVWASQNLGNVGDTVTFKAAAVDNFNVEGLSLLINGQAVTLDPQGFASFTLQTAGAITAQAIATDAAGNSGSASLQVESFNPDAAFKPTLALAINNGVVTAPTAIQGSVGGEGFTRYELAIAPLDSQDFKVVARGSSAVANGVLGTIDPSLLPNDAYTLRLAVFGANGAVSFVEETISIQGELKLGNFRLSFTDLAVPVTGIPITLTRTYDTLTANQSDDFGFGWRMEFRDTDLRTSLPQPSQEEQLLGRFPAFKDGTKVFITLPGGKREAFTFRAKRVESFKDGNQQLSTGMFANYFYEATFQSQAGSTHTLAIESPFFTKDANGRYVGFQQQPFNPADPLFGGVYVLTSKEGTQYRIDARTGDLVRVKDPNGNTLTYTDDAITSSTGQKVTFERDAQGRIVAVKDPMQELIRYQYDNNGDLVGVTDQEGNVTRFVYDATDADRDGKADRPHFLKDIIDPLGRTGARSVYDDAGRLKQVIDVNGKAVEMTYDMDRDRQVVKDALGNQTTYIYDVRGNVTREIDAEGKITDRAYDENNWMLSETVISDRSDNPNTPTLEGYTTKYTYDSQGNKLTETDTLGNTTYYTYGDKGRLLSETDSLGRTTTNTYDSRGNLTQTKDASGVITNYTYDSQGQLKGLTDTNGKTTEFAYTSRGDVYEVKDAQGNITHYTYNLRGDKLTERRYRTNADGTVETLLTTWTYDKEGRIKTMTNVDGTTTYEYDSAGRQIAAVDTLGRRSESVYNEKGELISTLTPDSTPNDSTDNPRMQYRYDAAGRKIAEIDVLGRETRFVYDKVGRLVETIVPDVTPTDWTDNARTRTEYYSDGLVKAQIDERGNRTEFRYDAAGWQIVVIAADATPNSLSDNPTTRYEYNKIGQQTAMTDALGHTTRYLYDDLGRLVKTTFADQTFTTQAYDNLGHRVAAVDANGKRTEYRYDDLGRLTGVKDALGQWTEYGYNAQGQLVYQEDANEQRTRYEYDSLGRRTATVLPMGQRSLMTYDTVGNVQSVTDFNGDRIIYHYDAQNRLIQKSFQDGSRVEYGYLLNGLQDTVTFRDGAGLVTLFYDYDYDVRDRLTKRTDTLGSGVTQTTRSIEYGYDAASNRTSVTTASGTTTYTYDERNRLDIVRLNGQLQADYGYDEVNRLTQTTFGNSTRETRQYDSLNRLKQLENWQGTTQLTRYAYTLDKVGNRTQVNEFQNGESRTLTYTYDDLYRLTEEAIADATNGNRTSSYVYDSVGNRQSKTVNGVTTTYEYDANDKLLREKVGDNTTVSYEYDNNGSTTKKVENGVSTTYIWNTEKRLVSATVGSTQVEYVYNDQGIRVSSNQNGVETRYLLDEGIVASVWEEYAPDLTVNASYAYGNDLIAQTQAGLTSYYLVDGLGSTRLLTDTQGQVLNTYGYEAFGQTVSQTGTTSNQYQFAGEQLDSTLGDYYLRQRFYDISSGRFGRMDVYEGSKQQPLSLHKYIYAHANPSNGIDPTGYLLFEVLSIGAVLAALAGLYVITNTIPFFTADDSQGLNWTEAYEIEKSILQYSLTLAQEDPDGSALQFAMLMGYTARQINPVRWTNNRRVRSDYLRIASDMFTEDDANDYGFLGNAGPRSQGRPKWLTQHEDDPYDWRDYFPDDREESRRLNKITGRRDHFITNAIVGFPVGNLAEKYLLKEGSQNDLMVNSLGRSFGIGVVNGSLTQYSIESWISSAM